MKNVIKIACCVLTICMLTSCMLLEIPLILLESSENQVVGEDLERYHKIESLAEEKAEVDLRQIFTDFEWDQVFFVKRETFSPDDFYEATGIIGDFYPLEDSRCLFALFTKGEKVVYQFDHDTLYMTFEPLEELIPYEEAVFSAEKDSADTWHLSKKA